MSASPLIPAPLEVTGTCFQDILQVRLRSRWRGRNAQVLGLHLQGCLKGGPCWSQGLGGGFLDLGILETFAAREARPGGGGTGSCCFLVLLGDLEQLVALQLLPLFTTLAAYKASSNAVIPNPVATARALADLIAPGPSRVHVHKDSAEASSVDVRGLLINTLNELNSLVIQFI